MFNTITEFAAAVDLETNAIASRIQALIDASTGLSDADKTTLQGISDRLTSLGQDPANPIPPTV